MECELMWTLASVKLTQQQQQAELSVKTLVKNKVCSLCARCFRGSALRQMQIKSN